MIKSSELEKYIFEQGEQRERTAIARLIADGSSSFSNIYQAQLNLALPWCWLGISIPQRSLLKGLKLNDDEFLGDIDLLGGNLEPISKDKYLLYVEEFKDPNAHPSWAYRLATEKVLWKREIKWPPSLDFIVATECKTSYFSSSNKLKSSKTNQKRQMKHRGQANELCKMGFNKIALTKIVVTEPIVSSKYHPWFEAGSRASYASKLITNETMTEESDSFGTVVVSVGAVNGGWENERGSLSWRWLKDTPENQLSEKSSLIRKTIEINLQPIMSQFSTPRQVPVLLLSCSNPKCLFIYASEANANAHCPKCSEKPR